MTRATWPLSLARTSALTQTVYCAVDLASMAVPGHRLLHVTRIACRKLGVDITFPCSRLLSEGSRQRSSPMQMRPRAGTAVFALLRAAYSCSYSRLFCNYCSYSRLNAAREHGPLGCARLAGPMSTHTSNRRNMKSRDAVRYGLSSRLSVGSGQCGVERRCDERHRSRRSACTRAARQHSPQTCTTCTWHITVLIAEPDGDTT